MSSKTAAAQPRKVFLTIAQLCERWGGQSHMFVERRLKTDPNFPRPMKFSPNAKRLFALDDVEAYERRAVANGGRKGAAE
jgi:hypothetical protein